jgi:hypothetical protein
MLPLRITASSFNSDLVSHLSASQKHLSNEPFSSTYHFCHLLKHVVSGLPATYSGSRHGLLTSYPSPKQGIKFFRKLITCM